ncbi:MAG TPA: hypothetical protein VFE32_17340 [Puia sp.]|nr:hypothetical protein [Puia sp.]
MAEVVELLQGKGKCGIPLDSVDAITVHAYAVGDLPPVFDHIVGNKQFHSSDHVFGDDPMGRG